MPGDPTKLLGSLLRTSTIEDHDEVLQAATAALHSSPGDSEIARIRVIALLKLDRIDDALAAIQQGGEGLSKLCAFERVYALYKAGKLDEAEKASQENDSYLLRSFRHLEAQIAYRAERFDDSLKNYAQLSPDSHESDGELNDITINCLAAQAQLLWKGASSSIKRSRKADTFELAYNSACSCIAAGDYQSAIVLLQLALKLCKTSDDLSEEDKKTEIVPLVVQKACVHAKLQQQEECIMLLQSLPSISPTDLETTTIAKVNLSLARASLGNPYLSHRVISQNTAAKTKSLFGFQRGLIRRNEYVADLYANKTVGIEARAEAFLSRQAMPNTSADVTNVSAIRAVSRLGGKPGKPSRRALRAVVSLLDKQPHDVGLLLIAVQWYVAANNPTAATVLLEAFFQAQKPGSGGPGADVRYSPGLVALAMTLYHSQGREAAAKAELVNAARYWNSRARHDGAALTLLREAGLHLMNSSEAEDIETAADSLEALRGQSTSDPLSSAGLVAACALGRLHEVEAEAKLLPQTNQLTAVVSVPVLLDGGVVVPSSASLHPRKRGVGDEGAGPLNKKRRRKLPKDYDAHRKMDPERWLPLRDRSTYRPKGKKGKKKANDATQGGIVKEEETLQLVGDSGAVRVEKSHASASAKKKKKGKK